MSQGGDGRPFEGDVRDVTCGTRMKQPYGSLGTDLWAEGAAGPKAPRWQNLGVREEGRRPG